MRKGVCERNSPFPCEAKRRQVHACKGLLIIRQLHLKPYDR